MFALGLALLLAAPCSPPAHAADQNQVDLAGARIVIGPRATDLEVFAARELARYFRVLCGKDSTVATEAAPALPAVLVGTPDCGLPGVEVPADLGDQGYVLRAVSGRPARFLIAGRTPVAVQYGAYSLLERLGVGFYLGGDALPEPRAELLLPADLNEATKPAFDMRGSLPWYNFLNSPTTWDLEDFEYFFDQMAKMKCNFVGFHSYDWEPFAAYPLDNAWHVAAPAASSQTYGWGTVRGMKTPEFGFGTGRYFFNEVFGSRSVTEAAGVGAREGETPAAWPTIERRTLPQDAVLRAQCSLAQGLDYARRRGIHVCVGFELTGDPTNAETRRQAEARIRHVLATYPMADYIWFWQSEGGGFGYDVPPPDTPLRLLCDDLKPAFEYLGTPKRIYEACRMAAYMQFAHSVVRRVRPETGVIVSGWGGDAWMTFSQFYVGFDKVLPKDVIFAALDNIDPSAQDHVSTAYGQLSPNRRRWPIPWFESDGGSLRRDQWGPQTNVKPYTKLLPDALQKGCQGILSIHWQTRGVEEVAAYLSQSAWSPDLSYEDFYRRFAGACFGPERAQEMADILMRLEALGPRWTGGAGQVECGGFSWFSDPRYPKSENLQQLAAIRARLAELRETCRQGPAQVHLERLNYLIATIDWLTNYDRAALVLMPGGEADKLLSAAEATAAAGKKDEATQQARKAVELIRDCGLREAMQTFPTRLTTQGEWGNLATINIKAYAMYEKTLARVKGLLGAVPPELTEAPAPNSPVLKMRTPPTALPQGAPFVVRAIALDESGIASVQLSYRQVGEAGFHAVAMDRAWGDSFTGAIPGAAIGERGVEFRVVATAKSGASAALPVGPPGAVWTASALPGTGPRLYGPVVQGEMALKPATDPQAPLFLRGAVMSDIEYDQTPLRFAVNPAASVPAEHQAYQLDLQALPTPTAAPAVQVSLSAADAVGRAATTGPVSVALLDQQPPAAPTDLRAEVAGPLLVRLEWGQVAGASGYDVRRIQSDMAAGSVASRWPWAICFDPGAPPGVAVRYEVAAINDAGVAGPASTVSLTVPDAPLPAAPAKLVATPNVNRVELKWDPVAEPTAGYAVMCEREGKWVVISGAEPLHEAAFRACALKPGQPYRLRVEAVDRAGRHGGPSAEITTTPLAPPHDPVFATNFDSLTAATGQVGTLHGKAALRDGVLDLREGGWISFPNDEALQLSGAVTVEMWVNIDRIQGIPVLFDFGHYTNIGYWLQYIGAVRWDIGRMQILDAQPVPSLLHWHHLVATYDGDMSRVYVDGVQTGERQVGAPDLTPWKGELRIGQYADIEDQFQTYGRIDDVRVYQRALSPEEVRKSFEAGRTSQ